MSSQKLSDHIKIETKTLNPLKHKDELFRIYSLPSYDNNRQPEFKLGSKVKAINNVVESNTILFNKLNVRFKRIWNIRDLGYELSLCSSEFLRIKPINCDQDFLYYLLSTDTITQGLTKASGGSSGSHSRISPEDLLSIKYNFPSIDEQRRISAALRSLDEKISLNIKINEELEKVVRHVYDYWFVQFDFPDSSGKPYRSSGGPMHYSDRLKREIPEGWRVGNIGDYSKLIRGVTYNKNDVIYKGSHDGLPILRATNITGNVIDLKEMVYLPESKINEEQLLEKNDILIVMSSGSKEHVGKNGIYYYEERVGFGAFCSKLQVDNGLKYYVGITLQTNHFYEYIQKTCLGTSINNLSNPDITSYDLVIADTATMKHFNKICEPLYEKIANNTNEIRELNKLREWLLPMLINGQAKVVP